MYQQSSMPALPETWETLLLEFEAAWSRKEAPLLSPYLPQDATPQYMMELVRIDIARRRSKLLPVEFHYYLREMPSLAESAQLLKQLQRMLQKSKEEVSVNDTHALMLHSALNGLEPHARGGLGEVLVACDTILDRKVAIKLLQTRWADSSQAKQDFLFEAKLTSQLEHPGIVPIHSVGQSPDGRPCYSMRYIQGQTLRDAIDIHHRQSIAGEGQNVVNFRHLLSRFIAVCQTIAYAHSKNVIHRDIKPENIMLGQFGETIVLDWGMAKTTEQIDPAATIVDLPQMPETNSGYTASVQGTLGYLSPEQARGDEHLTFATDIFGLGATLYTILCNRPPILELSKDLALKKARKGEIVPPSQYVRNVPKALEAICLQALALQPTRRYASAQALAADLEQYLANEPVSAWKEPWTFRFRRALRKRKSLVAVLISLGIVIPIGAAVGSWMISREHGRAELSEQTSRIKQETAQQITDYLTRLFQLADPLHKTEIAAADENGQETITIYLERGKELIREHLQDQPLVRAELLDAIGNTYRSLGQYEQSHALVSEAYDIRHQMLGKEHLSTLASMLSMGCSAQDTGNYQGADEYFREVIRLREKLLGKDHILVAQAKYYLGNLTFYRPLSVEGPQFIERLRQDAEDLLQEALRIQKSQPNVNFFDVGMTLAAISSIKLNQPGQESVMQDYAQRAMQAFSKTRYARTLGTLNVRLLLAEGLRRNQQYDQAEKSYLDILADMKKFLGPRHPMTILHMGNYVGLVHKRGDMDRALVLAKEYLEVIKPFPWFRSQPMIIERMIYFCEVVLQRGQLEEAKSGLQLALQLAKERPKENAAHIEKINSRLKELAAGTQ